MESCSGRRAGFGKLPVSPQLQLHCTAVPLPGRVTNNIQHTGTHPHPHSDSYSNEFGQSSINRQLHALKPHRVDKKTDGVVRMFNAVLSSMELEAGLGDLGLAEPAYTVETSEEVGRHVVTNRCRVIKQIFILEGAES